MVLVARLRIEISGYVATTDICQCLACGAPPGEIATTSSPPSPPLHAVHHPLNEPTQPYEVVRLSHDNEASQRGFRHHSVPAGLSPSNCIPIYDTRHRSMVTSHSKPRVLGRTLRHRGERRWASNQRLGEAVPLDLDCRPARR